MVKNFATAPANIMTGLQALTGAVESYGQFQRDKAKRGKVEQLKQQASRLIGQDPEIIAKEVAKNPELRELMKNAMGAESDAMLNISKQYLIEGQDPFNLHVAEAEKDILEGRDPSGNIEMSRALLGEKTRGEATKKHEAVLAMFDPKAYKAYADQQGKGSFDEKPKHQKTAAYLVKNAEGKTQIIVGDYDTSTGKLVVEGGELPEGYEPVSKLGETGKEETERKVGQKEKTTRVTTKEQRASALIDRGITSAESTAIIRRGIKLLDSVATGGFDNAALRAKQIFGIESADEGELSNSLGKSVLSQLRETFGAAFTENEGNRLARIEAGFGKSVSSNKRLLKQALSLAERTAKRAMDAAYERGDMDAVNDINELLTFSLDDVEKTEEKAAEQSGNTTPEQHKQLPSGATYTFGGKTFRKK